MLENNSSLNYFVELTSFYGGRNVYKVGVAYAIVACLLIQFAAIAFPHLNFPSWTVIFVIVVFIIGFPLILLFAWAFEITPEGIKRTKEVPLSESINHLTGKKLNYMLVGLLMVAVAYILFDNYYLDRRVEETKVATTVDELIPVAVDVKESPKTIAVLPFDDLSPEKDHEYFVNGLSEEIINCLVQIPDLNVTGKTSSFSFKGSNKTIQEIAEILSVENILEGSVRKAGSALRITAQLLRGADGFHLWSKTYDKELKDIFAVQEDIAAAVADEIKVTLGIGHSFKQLGSTDNLEAYELYLVAQGQINNWESNKALESSEAAIALDPNFALAWVTKGFAHSLLAIFGSADRAASELDAALNAVERAIELEPQLREAYCLLNYVETNRGEWIKAESAYRKALELQTGTLSSYEYVINIYYHAVGYFKKAQELLRKTLQSDPLHPIVRGHYMLNLAFLGDMKRAENEYEHGMALFEGQWTQGDNYITHLRLGSGDVVYSDIVFPSEVYNSAKEHLDSPKEGLSELHRIYMSGDNLSSEDFVQIAICAAYFGDNEFALTAMEKALGIQTSGAFFFWLPVFKEVRQLPRFKEFVREIGLVDYWNVYVWPGICRQLDNGDFECD